MDDLDIVAGIVEQVVGVGLVLRQMRRDQREIGGVEPPQQIVERPLAGRAVASAPRQHCKFPCPPSRHNSRSSPQFMCAQVNRQRKSDVVVSVPEPADALFEAPAAAVLSGASARDLRPRPSNLDLARPWNPPLHGMPNDVLIVEDDPIIALDFEDTILGFGVKTVRTAGNVAKALDMIADRAAGFCAARCRPDPRKELCGRRTAGGAENSLRLRHRLRRRRQASAGLRGQAAAAKTLLDRRAARLLRWTAALSRSAALLSESGWLYYPAWDRASSTTARRRRGRARSPSSARSRRRS